MDKQCKGTKQTKREKDQYKKGENKGGRRGRGLPCETRDKTEVGTGNRNQTMLLPMVIKAFYVKHYWNKNILQALQGYYLLPCTVPSIYTLINAVPLYWAFKCQAINLSL